MGHSSLVGVQRASATPAGHDNASLGPSDSSDSGSDMAGLEDRDVSDPTEPVDVATRDDMQRASLQSDAMGGFGSDASGTGERRSAAADGGLREADFVACCSESTFARDGDKCLQFFDHSQILIVFLRNIY